MANATAYDHSDGHDVYATRRDLGQPPTIKSLLREIGPCVYYIRTSDGLIKIGHTVDLMRRRRRFGTDPRRLLAVVPGSMDDEMAVHRLLRPHVARGREYYHPAPEVIAHIDAIRERLGVDPIEPWWTERPQSA